jgi:hypothetical protein
MNHVYIFLNLNGFFTYKGSSLANHPLITQGITLENSCFWWSHDEYNKPNITYEQIERLFYMQKYDHRVRSLCRNPSISWYDVLLYPDIKWNYGTLSENPNITWDIVQVNQDKDWSYKILSSNPNITWDIVCNNSNRKWSFTQLSKNPNITWDIVQDNPDRKWSYVMLSENPNITLDMVKKKPNEKWDYRSLSWNPNITWNMLLDEKCFRNHKNTFHKNPNTTWKDMYYNLGSNIFNARCGKFDRWNAASKIQHVFRRWNRKMRIEASTQLLSREDMLGDKLPYEVIFYAMVKMYV